MFQFTDTRTESEKGRWVHLKDNGVKAYLDAERTKPVRVKVYGTDSLTLQMRSKKRLAKRLKKIGGSMDMSKMSEAEILNFLEETGDSAWENTFDTLMDWENIPGPDGQPMPFTAENAEMVLKNYPAIVRDITEQSGDIDDFLALDV